jgi:hypothetical protein
MERRYRAEGHVLPALVLASKTLVLVLDVKITRHGLGRKIELGLSTERRGSSRLSILCLPKEVDSLLGSHWKNEGIANQEIRNNVQLENPSPGENMVESLGGDESTPRKGIRGQGAYLGEGILSRAT